MKRCKSILPVIALGSVSSIGPAMVAAETAAAETRRSGVAFNNGIGEKTAKQPERGVEVACQITLKGGDLDRCTVDVVEQLFGRNEGAWGILDIKGDLNCDRGGFGYASFGAWDGNGFHAAGAILDGSGGGEFAGISGRVAQLKSGGADAGHGTYDISYDLVFDTPGDWAIPPPDPPHSTNRRHHGYFADIRLITPGEPAAAGNATGRLRAARPGPGLSGPLSRGRCTWRCPCRRRCRASPGLSWRRA